MPVELPDPMPPFGQYVPAVRSGDQLWLGGHFGVRADGAIHTGRVGDEVDLERAQDAARSAALSLLATVVAELGSLDRVARVLRVGGVVNSTPDFDEQTSVLDAASDVIVEVLGERGRHTRLAVGVAALPGNLTLEIDAVLAVSPDASAGDAPRIDA